MKKQRQEKLKELVTQYEIETQDELISMLRHHGYDVTQATASRDIRELHISKMPTGKGTYRYAVPKSQKKTEGIHFNSALIDSLKSVDYACNLVVLKTAAGLAPAVAVGIDGMNLPKLLGSVAGDDTIMIVARDEQCAAEITAQIQDLIAQE